MSIVNTESLAKMFATLRDRLVLMLDIPYKARMSLKEATSFEVKASGTSFSLVYEKDGVKHSLSVIPGDDTDAPALVAPATVVDPKTPFQTMGELRAIMKQLEHHPDNEFINVQLISSNPEHGGAWYMRGQFGEVEQYKALVMTISHPDLKAITIGTFRVMSVGLKLDDSIQIQPYMTWLSLKQ